MTKTTKFEEKAKAYIDEIGEELGELEQKAKHAGEDADEWSAAQVAKLKEDWAKARTEMEDIAQRAREEGEDSIRDAREKAERHWDALQAAVKAYRDHLEKVADA